MKQILFSSVFVVSFVAIAEANPMANCKNTQGKDNCTPVYACIGEAGEWFKGHALGWDTGILAGESNLGRVCKGNWTAKNRLGMGQVNMECDDGTLMLIYFTSQDPETGTATGTGITSDNQRIEGWSGKHVLAFFKTYQGWPEGTLVCGMKSIPLS